MNFCMFHLETILRFIRFLMGICVCERIYNFKKKWTVSIHWHSLNHFATNSLEQVCSFLNFGICCILISICYERDVYTHMLYVSVIFSQFFSFISISIGSEELNVVSSCIYKTTLKCSREHNQEKVFDVLKRVTLYRFWTKIRFLKIFIIVFISKLIYVNYRVLVYWQKMEDHPQKNNDK